MARLLKRFVCPQPARERQFQKDRLRKRFPFRVEPVLTLAVAQVAVLPQKKLTELSEVRSPVRVALPLGFPTVG